MRLGEVELFPLSDGSFWLDGGAMFGVVPKVLWQRTNPSDDRNRICLGLHPLLVKTKRENILIETGIGDKIPDKFKEIYKVEKEKELIQSLEDTGVSSEDIDIVILTHLHFDHCGWNTRRASDGRIVPTFKNARYFIQKAEWERALNPDPRSKASYLRENFLPLEEYGNLRLISGDTEITEGIEVILTGGHTQGHQVVLINRRAIYWGDLIPTTSHIRIPYVMGYDLFPLDTMRSKERLLDRAIKENWLSVFEHDPQVSIARLKREGDRIIAERVE